MNTTANSVIFANNATMPLLQQADPAVYKSLKRRPALMRALWFGFLEKILQRELHDARVSRRLQLTECPIADRIVRVIEIRVVEQVEEFAPELYLPVFVDRKFLEQGEIYIHQARPGQEVSACHSESTRCCILESCSVEVSVYSSAACWT